MEEAAPAKKTGRHLAASQTTVDDTPKKTARKTATGTEKAAPKKRAVKAPAGKTVKVAASKSTPKKSATKSASSAPKRAPAKRAVKAKPSE
jgi:ribosome-associated protein